MTVSQACYPSPESRRQICIIDAAARAAPGSTGRGGVIGPAKLSAGREKYYLREVADDREAYLTGHGEAPGYTLGSAWTRLGSREW